MKLIHLTTTLVLLSCTHAPYTQQAKHIKNKRAIASLPICLNYFEFKDFLRQVQFMPSHNPTSPWFPLGNKGRYAIEEEGKVRVYENNEIIFEMLLGEESYAYRLEGDWLAIQHTHHEFMDIYSINTGELVHHFPKRQDHGVYHLSISTNGKALIHIEAENGPSDQIIVMDLITKKEEFRSRVKNLGMYGYYVWGKGDSKYILSSSRDEDSNHPISVFELNSDSMQLQKILELTELPAAMAAEHSGSPNAGENVVSILSSKNKSGRPPSFFEEVEENTTSSLVEITYDQKHLIITENNGGITGYGNTLRSQVLIYSVFSKNLIRRITIAHHEIAEMALSTDSTKIALIVDNNQQRKIMVYDLHTTQLIKEFEWPHLSLFVGTPPYPHILRWIDSQTLHVSTLHGWIVKYKL